MEFSIRKKITITEWGRKRSSYEIHGYSYDEYGTFAIGKLKKTDMELWGIIHVPSERSLITIFQSKKEAESFFDVLIQLIDINSLELMTPDNTEKIISAIRVAYGNWVKWR